MKMRRPQRLRANDRARRTTVLPLSAAPPPTERHRAPRRARDRASRRPCDHAAGNAVSNVSSTGGDSVATMEPWELTGREQVRDLIARYTWAGDRGRFDDLVACFSEDGVLDVGDHGGRWVGRGEIARQLQGVAARVADHA